MKPAHRRAVLAFSTVLFACGDTPPEPTIAPLAITGVNRSHIDWNDTITVLEITGTGFTPGSQASLYGNGRGVRLTHLSIEPTLIRVRAAEFDPYGGGSFYMLSVSRGTPDGAKTPYIPFPVHNPVAIVESLVPDSIITDEEDRSIRIHGRNFLFGAVLRSGTSARSGDVLGATEALIILQPNDIVTPGLREISVWNTLPRVGTAPGVSLRVVRGTPRITALDPSHVTAGGDGFTLAVSGRNFSTGSLVWWNGAPRPTTYVSPTELRLDVGPADVGTPGTRSIHVRDEDRQSLEHAFPVLPASAGVSVLHVIDVAVNRLIYDPTRDLIYAAVRSSSAAYAGRIIALDPLTGVVRNSLFVGGDPDALALSSDARYLYIGRRQHAIVTRIDLTDFAPDLHIPLPTRPFFPSGSATHLVSPEAEPRTVVALVDYGGATTLHAFDDNVPRPVAMEAPAATVSTITRGPKPDEIFGYDGMSTGHHLWRIRIAPDGLRDPYAREGLIHHFGTRITYDGGLIFGTNGDIVDAAAMSYRGRLPHGGPLHPDVLGGRVFVGRASSVNVYHPASRTLIGSFAAAPDSIHGIVRWGGDGLAVHTASAVRILRGALIGDP